MNLFSIVQGEDLADLTRKLNRLADKSCFPVWNTFDKEQCMVIVKNQGL